MLAIQFLLGLLVLGYFLSAAVMVFFLWPSFKGQNKRKKEEKKQKRQNEIWKAIHQREEREERHGERLERVLRQAPRDEDDGPELRGRGELRPDFDAMILRARAKIEMIERDIETLKRAQAAAEPHQDH